MKALKKTRLVLSIIFVLLIVFRAPIFNNLVTYKSIGNKVSNKVVNIELKNYIEEYSKKGKNRYREY